MTEQRPKKHFPVWLLWLALILAVIAAVFLLPWRQVWSALLDADKFWILVAVCICLLDMPLTATMWRLFLPPQIKLAWARVFEIVSLSRTARTTLPLMGGDASSVGILMVRGGLGIGSAVLVLTLDQLFTGLGKVAFIFATLASASPPPFLTTAGTTLAVLVALFLAAMVIAAVYGRSLHGLAGMFPRRMEILVRRVADLTANLDLLRRPLRLAGACLLMALKKSVEVGAALAIQYAVGIDLPIGSTILVVTALNLATVIPALPANLGAFEAAILLVYHYLGVPDGVAFAAAILQHAVYLTRDFGCGYAVLLTETMRRKQQVS